MKKILSIVFILMMMFLICSCGVNVVELDGENKGYYYEYSEGIKTVTNYHPTNIFSLPDYQEMIQYGDGAGLENEGVVYFIYIVDTSLDPEDAKAYYSAEFDGETRELLFEEGEYFSDETEKNEVVERLFEVLDSIENK